MAAVSVVEDATASRAAHQQPATGRQQRHASLDARQAWLPLLLHPAPHRALFLGLGTGVTAASAAEDPTLRGRRGRAAARGDRRVGALHARARPDAPSDRAARDGRRRAPLRARERPPLRRDRLGQLPPGAQRLGRAVHRRALRGRARAARGGGAVLPVAAAAPARSRHPAQHRAQLPRRVSARLGDAREQQPGDARARARRARDDERLRPRGRSATRLAQRDVARQRRRISGSKTSSRCSAASSRARRRCERFAGDAPLNTDDRPVVAYRAPRITYAPDSLPRDRLFALLRAAVDIAPERADRVRPTPAGARRLAAYWSARDRFIEVGRDVRAVARRRTRCWRRCASRCSPCCASVRTSGPRTIRCCAWQTALNESDPAAARALLDDLAHVHPTVTAGQ